MPKKTEHTKPLAATDIRAEKKSKNLRKTRINQKKTHSPPYTIFFFENIRKH